MNQQDFAPYMRHACSLLLIVVTVYHAIPDRRWGQVHRI